MRFSLLRRLTAKIPADSQIFPGLGLVIALRGFLHRKAWRTHNLSANQCKSVFVYLPAACLDERSTGGQPEGVTALHMICGGADRFAERSAIATELVRLCASVNIRHSRTKATPILRAAGSGSEQMVRLLLGLRADPNVCNEQGATPLDVAMRNSGKAHDWKIDGSGWRC